MSNSVGTLPPALENLAIKQPAAKSAKTLGQDTFLKLMVAQMNNQDPSKPMDSSQFLSQLAQFGTVNGISQLQNSFQSLASALQSSQALQASTLVGRNVLVQGDTMRLASAGAQLSGAIDLAQATGDLTVKIYNSAGQLVKQLQMGAQAAGQPQFTWEGLDNNGNAVPAGVYRVVAEAQIDGQTRALQTLMQGRVESVSLQANGGSRLNLAGLGAVGMEEVRLVR